METAIRWSPSSTPSDPRFLIADVTGRTFKHCRVTGTLQGEVQWQELARNAKVPAFRAFDWSARHDVIAVGQWSGETTVLHLDGSTGSSLSLPVKSQRQCNAIAFNTDSLLATGLEKIRNDFCLQVYDVAHWTGDRKKPQNFDAGASIRQSSESASTLRSQTTEPVRRLASSEGIISIKFFPQHPHTLVAGVKASCVRLYDLRDNSGNPALQWPTPCVHNIAIDPSDPNYFASASPLRDATVHVWDRRAAPRMPGGGSNDGAVLRLKDVFHDDHSGDAVYVWSLKYSPAESGCLGILGSGGNFRVIRTKKDYIEPTAPGTSAANDETPQNLYVHSTETIGRVPAPQLRQTIRPSEKQLPIQAFDFMNVLSGDRRACAITLRGHQNVGIFKQRSAPPVLVSSMLHEVMSAPAKKSKALRDTVHGMDFWWRPGGDSNSETPISKDLKMRCRSLVPLLQGKHINALPKPAQGLVTEDDGWNDDPRPPSLEQKNTFKDVAAKLHIGDVLIFADTPRRRCQEGYLFDAEKNEDIVEDNPALQDLWRWMATAIRNAADGRMATEQVDFSYVGLFHIWNAHLGPHAETRITGDSVNIGSALENLSAQLELWDVDFPKTTKLAQRKLCLHVCGFDTNPEDMLAKVKPLALRGRSVEGAFRALIGDDWQLAITALRSGPRHQQNRALGSVIALFGERESPDRIQRQASELLGDDRSIFTQAIIAYLTRTQPSSDLAAQLPVPYRAALAIKLAPDHELTSFIAERTQSAIREGDVAHVLYTGLSGDALPLFTRFVERTHDVQTAILALSRVSPRFLRAERIAQWRVIYRDQLNAWRLFLQRAQFDVQATQLSASHDGTPTLLPAARQVTLRCTNCDGPLHRDTSSYTGLTQSQSHHQQADMPKQPAGAVRGPPAAVLGSTKDGTRCLRCGAGMPRCVVCDHRTGVVDPLTKGGAEAERRKMERTESGKDTMRSEERNEAFDNLTEICLTCRHVYHRGHAAAWFARHTICAAVDCDCTCNVLDGKA